jgi:hypothetical protein
LPCPFFSWTPSTNQCCRYVYCRYKCSRASCIYLILSLSISYPYLIKFHDFADNSQKGMTEPFVLHDSTSWELANTSPYWSVGWFVHLFHNWLGKAFSKLFFLSQTKYQIIRFWLFFNLVYNQFVCLKNTLDNQLP